MTKGQKVWDVIYPTVCILICMVAATIVGLIVLNGLYGDNGLTGDQLLDAIPDASYWISSICFLLAILLMGRNYKSDSRLRFFASDRKSPIYILVFGCLAIVFVGAFLAKGMEVAGISGVLTSLQGVGLYSGGVSLPVILATVLLGPIAEELVFRGLTYRRAKAVLGKKAALVISALLFGIYHGNLIQLVYGFVMGILLGILYDYSGKLLVSILAHAAMNLWMLLAGIYTRHLESAAGIAPGYCVLLLAVPAIACLVILHICIKRNIN